VAQFLLNNQIEDQFHLPLSVQAFQEYQEMQQIIQQIQISDQNKDNWQYIWGNSTYTSSKFYIYPTTMFILPNPSSGSGIPVVLIRSMSSLGSMDRLNVKNILRRKKQKLQDNNYNCVLCSRNCEETTFHLFFSCQFSQRCWTHLPINWRLDLPFHAMMEQAKGQANHNFFMELFIIAAWTIWK
jgi:hypothetical protein